jgi:hypothetical protein
VSKIVSQSKGICPINCLGSNKTYNLDGVLIYSPEREGKSCSYVQLFRSGVVEAVEGGLLEPVTGTLNKDLEGKLMIPSRSYEEELIRSFSNYLSYLKELNVDLPIVVFLSLLGVKGYSMGVSSRITRHYGIYTIDRDILLLPEAIIESYDVSADEVLRPCFDSIWNACGFPKDFYYNEEGKWVPTT